MPLIHWHCAPEEQFCGAHFFDIKNTHKSRPAHFCYHSNQQRYNQLQENIDNVAHIRKRFTRHYALCDSGLSALCYLCQVFAYTYYYSYLLFSPISQCGMEGTRNSLLCLWHLFHLYHMARRIEDGLGQPYSKLLG